MKIKFIFRFDPNWYKLWSYNYQYKNIFSIVFRDPENEVCCQYCCPFALICQVHYWYWIESENFLKVISFIRKRGKRREIIRNEKLKSTEIACFLQFVSREETILHAISDIMSRNMDFTFIKFVLKDIERETWEINMRS